MKKARLCLRLLVILIKQNTEGTRTKWKTIAHLAEVTTSKSWFHLPLSSLRLIHQDINKEYFAIKKNDKSIGVHGQKMLPRLQLPTMIWRRRGTFTKCCIVKWNKSVIYA
eukprot:1025018-Ditylum_brightwellii.AAC.1